MIVVETLVHATVNNSEICCIWFLTWFQSSDEKENKKVGSDSSDESESGSDTEKKKNRKKKKEKGKKKKVCSIQFILNSESFQIISTDWSFWPAWKPSYYTWDRVPSPEMAVQHSILWQRPLLYSPRRKGTFSIRTHALQYLGCCNCKSILLILFFECRLVLQFHRSRVMTRRLLRNHPIIRYSTLLLKTLRPSHRRCFSAGMRPWTRRMHFNSNPSRSSTEWRLKLYNCFALLLLLLPLLHLRTLDNQRHLQILACFQQL